MFFSGQTLLFNIFFLSHCSHCLEFSLKFTHNFYVGSLFCLHYLLSSLLLLSFLHLTSACWGTYLLTLDVTHLVFCNINSSLYRQTFIYHYMLSLWLFKKIKPTPNVYFYSTTSLDDFCFCIIRLLTSFKLGVCPVTG